MHVHYGQARPFVNTFVCVETTSYAFWSINQAWETIPLSVLPSHQEVKGQTSKSKAESWHLMSEVHHRRTFTQPSAREEEEEVVTWSPTATKPRRGESKQKVTERGGVPAQVKDECSNAESGTSLHKNKWDFYGNRTIITPTVSLLIIIVLNPQD